MDFLPPWLVYDVQGSLESKKVEEDPIFYSTKDSVLITSLFCLTEKDFCAGFLYLRKMLVPFSILAFCITATLSYRK
jgi:hypothetical protein